MIAKLPPPPPLREAFYVNHTRKLISTFRQCLSFSCYWSNRSPLLSSPMICFSPTSKLYSHLDGVFGEWPVVIQGEFDLNMTWITFNLNKYSIPWHLTLKVALQLDSTELRVLLLCVRMASSCLCRNERYQIECLPNIVEWTLLYYYTDKWYIQKYIL